MLKHYEHTSLVCNIEVHSRKRSKPKQGTVAKASKVARRMSVHSHTVMCTAALLR
jgi:hypothetical protein